MVNWPTGWSHELGPSFQLTHISEYLTLHELCQTVPTPKCLRPYLATESLLGDEPSAQIPLSLCVCLCCELCLRVKVPRVFSRHVKHPSCPSESGWTSCEPRTGTGYLWMNPPPRHRPPGGWSSSTLAAPGVLVRTEGRKGKWDGSHCNCGTRGPGSFIKQISFAGRPCTSRCAALSFCRECRWSDVR